MTVIKNVGDLSKDLGDLLKQRFTGEIALGEQDRRVTIHLSDGKVIYVIDKFHPVRRWLRAIQKYCDQGTIARFPKESYGQSASADLISTDLAAQKKLTNYKQLSQAIAKQQIGLFQAQAIIKEIAKECFFELFAEQHIFGELTWKTDNNIKTAESLDLALTAEQTQAILLEAKQLQQQWSNANLSNYMPTLAAVLEQEQKYQAVEIPIPQSYLQGNDTFWDIAAKTKTPVMVVARSLVHLQQQNILKFQEIPDIPGESNGNGKSTILLSPPAKSDSDTLNTSPSVTTNSKNKVDKSRLDTSTTYDRLKPLIACIDDSPVLGHSVKKILASVGYQSMIIREPMTGIGLLAKHRPNLIILDLLMPTVNGYSVCKFLRETSLFKTTPIIILTARDTIVDRTRAKLAGATDFLTKPPEPQELLQVVRQHLIDIPWS
jgi:two-component system, chemotaxis family, response regulator PixG